MKKLLAVLFFAVPFLVGGLAHGATVEEIMKKSQGAYYYPGSDYKARITMRLVARSGQERMREMAFLRKNYGVQGGEQKYFIYFYQPADVKDTTFMVYKYPNKDSDRWLFVPSINMVRRIAAQDKRSSFVGSDFTYEDVSGRNINDDDHVLVKEERLGSSDTYVVKSTPKAQDVDYGYKLSWIDKKTYLPMKEEYYDKRGELYKVFTADAVKDIKGFPTVVKRTMKNLQSGHWTEVVTSNVDYNIGLEDSLFSERFLKAPPKKRLE